MWKGSSRQIGHGGPFRPGTRGGDSLVRATRSSLCSVGTFGVSLAGASNTVVGSAGNVLDNTEGFVVFLLTYFRFGGRAGGMVLLALDKMAAATSDWTLVLALV